MFIIILLFINVTYFCFRTHCMRPYIVDKFLILIRAVTSASSMYPLVNREKLRVVITIF